MKINLPLVKQRLFNDASGNIVRDFGLKGRYNNPTSLADALIGALNQPPVHNPISDNPNTSKVFKAAVWAIGSSNTNWIGFLRCEPKLRISLNNYDPCAVVSHGLTSVLLAPILPPGQARGRQADAIIIWANILCHNPFYYTNLIINKAISFQKFNPAFRNSELMVCLVGYFGRLPSQHQDKLHGMQYAITSEFLRNLGWNGFKVDTHIGRLLRNWESVHLPRFGNAYRNLSTILKTKTSQICSILGAKNKALYDYIYYSLLALELTPCHVPYNHMDNLLWALGRYVEKKGKVSNIIYVK